MRRIAGLLLLVAACTTTTDRPTSVPPPTVRPSTAQPPQSTTVSTTVNDPTTTTTLPALVTALPDGPCQLGETPSEGEVTFAIDARIYGALPDGSRVRCLVEVDEAIESIEWSPTGDRLLLNGRVHPRDDALEPPPPPSDPLKWFIRAAEWTRPTGQGVVYEYSHRGNGSRLMKVKPGEVVDLSATFSNANLPVYHPAGTHLVVREEGRVWLMTNDGIEAVLLASNEEAEIMEYEFDLNGDLVFLAHHAGASHVHKLVSGENGELESPILMESVLPLFGLRVSPFAPLIAYSESVVAGCSHRLGIIGVEVPSPLDSLGALPVGWLPNDQLVAAAQSPGCLGPYSDLYVFSTGLCPGTPYGVTKLVSGVEGPATVRTVAPPAPPPPGENLIESTAPA